MELGALQELIVDFDCGSLCQLGDLAICRRRWLGGHCTVATLPDHLLALKREPFEALFAQFLQFVALANGQEACSGLDHAIDVLVLDLVRLV